MSSGLSEQQTDTTYGFLGNLLTQADGEFAQAIAKLVNQPNTVIQRVRFTGKTQLPNILGGEIGWFPDLDLDNSVAAGGWVEYLGAEVCSIPGLPKGNPAIARVARWDPGQPGHNLPNGDPGTDLIVRINGSNTHFNEGTEISFSNNGITHEDPVVISNTQLEVSIHKQYVWQTAYE